MATGESQDDSLQNLARARRRTPRRSSSCAARRAGAATCSAAVLVGCPSAVHI
jgi:hypothetical protein